MKALTRIEGGWVARWGPAPHHATKVMDISRGGTMGALLAASEIVRTRNVIVATESEHRSARHGLHSKERR